MADAAISNSEIEAQYRQRTPKSAGRTAAAKDIFPSGIVHDSRKTDPYPIYVERAKGSGYGYGALRSGRCTVIGVDSDICWAAWERGQSDLVTCGQSKK